MINKKVKLGPKPKEAAQSNEESAIQKYTEAELKYLEICLVREHLEHARQLNIDPKSMDPKALVQMYQKSRLNLPGFEEQTKQAKTRIEQQ